jgi:hypothetical protein
VAQLQRCRETVEEANSISRALDVQKEEPLLIFFKFSGKKPKL